LSSRCLRHPSPTHALPTGAQKHRQLSPYTGWPPPRRSTLDPNSSEIPWPLAATTDENGDARPSSALIGACEPVSEIDAGAFPAPRTVCCEHPFQHRFRGWPCRSSPAQAIRSEVAAVELVVG